MPQPKKHVSARARRNKASTAATLTPTAFDPDKVPELPERPAGWHDMTRQWWVDTWSSPMRAEWHFATDIHNVYAAAMHYDDMWRATDPNDRQKADAAFQKREAALGLTPYDRRRLEWTIASAKEATTRSQRSATQPAPKKRTAKATDPRGPLTLVG